LVTAAHRDNDVGPLGELEGQRLGTAVTDVDADDNHHFNRYT
jgi:hypothetical protein